MFILFDYICADTLEIPVQEYVEKVEKLSEKRQYIVIGNLLDINLTEEKLIKLKRIFNSL